MNTLAYLLGISVSIAGLGGLLSGIFSRSLRRALIFGVIFGCIETAILLSNSRFAPIFIFIGVFWSLVGWVLVGRFFAKRRTERRAKIR